MPKSTFRIRFALVGVLSTLALGFILSPSVAQPGRPGFGRPPGGIGGRPPGGITGMPGGGITGRPPGGITGMPGGISGGGIAGRPPGGITGISGGGIGGMPLGPTTSTYTWSCGKCGKSLGTTTTPFSPHTTCPHCGVFFTGTNITHSGMGGAPPITPPTPARPPSFGGMGGSSLTNRPPSNPSAPALPPNPLFNLGGSSNRPPAPSGNAPEPSNTASSDDDDDSTPTTTTTSSPRNKSRILWALGGILGVFMLLGVLALGMVVLKASASQPTRRPRRRSLDLDDDD